jgi:hypothetical protein
MSTRPHARLGWFRLRIPHPSRLLVGQLYIPGCVSSAGRIGR